MPRPAKRLLSSRMPDADFNNKYGVPVDNARYNHTTNLDVTRKRIGAYTCPSDMPNRPFGNITSHNYAVNCGNTAYGQQGNLNRVAYKPSPFPISGAGTPARNKRFKDIPDGMTNTFDGGGSAAGGGT